MKDTHLQVGAILSGPSGQQWQIVGRKESSFHEVGDARLTLQTLPGTGKVNARKRLLRSLFDLMHKIDAGHWRLVSPNPSRFDD